MPHFGGLLHRFLIPKVPGTAPPPPKKSLIHPCQVCLIALADSPPLKNNGPSLSQVHLFKGFCTAMSD